MARVLVVDDDERLLKMLQRTLTYEGFDVTTAADGLEALARLGELPPDVIILDWMMPRLDGVGVLEALSIEHNQTPVLMLTARDAVQYRVEGLERGADDYLIKPFEPIELIARVRALLRRVGQDTQTTLVFDDLALDPSSREVSRGTRKFDLTPTEFDLLHLFMRHPNQVLERGQILSQVWGYNFAGDDNIIEVYVGYLRKKTEAEGESTVDPDRPRHRICASGADLVSIRLRLTLLYSAILALTLIAFSTVLYVTQAQYTLNIVKRDLDSNARQLMLAWSRFQTGWDARGLAPRQMPLPPDLSYGEQAQQALQPLVRGELARDSVHLLDSTGQALDVAINEQSPTLPISTEGMAELQTGTAWMEISQGEDSRWLIFNLPVITEVGSSTAGSAGPNVIGIVQLARSLADRDRSLHSMGITLVVGSFATTVLAFGAGWLLAGTTLKPIQKITETAQEIGRSQDFSSRVEHDGPNDELGRLATTFNSMLARLQGSYQQLAHALEVQRDFVADVSHELRTPLTTVRGNLALMKHDPPLPADEQAEILDDLIAESARLSRLISDLLTLARADAGHRLPVAPVEVESIVDDVCRQAHLLAPEREVTCDLQAPTPSSANEDALKQVLLILMDNAIKHGEGPIRVATRESDRHILISVHDSGPGMPKDLQDRVFDRFYRGDASRTTPGFGLGLSIARSLTEAQEGTISMESQCGVGSTFVIELPTAEQNATSDE